MSEFPYPGLRPFERDEVDIFFGRDQQVYELLERLGQTHFLAVLGGSGCGKSSLVRTGLLPSLDSGFLTSAGSNWRLAEMRPGNKPFENLTRVLLDALGDSYRAGFRDPTQAASFLQVALQRGAGSLGEILRESPLPPQTNLLLLVDQFEEIFRYRATEQATAFVWFLLESSRLPNVYITITMRSDFLGDCSHFLGLPEAINQGLYLTPRLSRDQLRDAIELPALVFNSQVEPALVSRLLNDVGNNPDQLPLLQHALMQMWQVEKGQPLTLADYAQIGGLGKALANHLERIFSRLKPAQQRLAEILFRNLCERRDGNRDTRRPVKLAEVATLADVDDSEIIAIVDEFRKEGRSFLTPHYAKPLVADSIIDISHESLIRQWPRLKEWVAKESKSAAIYRRLEKNAVLWKNKEHGLYRSPELENALTWQQTQKPTPLWAGRYGRHFGLAMLFLEESVKKQQRQLERLQQQQQQKRKQLHTQQQQKLKQARLLALVTGFTLLAVLRLADWAWEKRDDAENKMRQIAQLEKQHLTELFQSLLIQAALLAKSEDYAAAKDVLEKTQNLENKVEGYHVHARNLLASFTQMISASAEKMYEGAGYSLVALAISPDGQFAVAAGEHGTLVVFEVKTGRLLQRLAGHGIEGTALDNTVRTVLFTPQGDQLISAGDDKKLIIWHRQQQRFQPQTMMGFAQKIKALAINPNGQTLAIGTVDGQIYLWDFVHGQLSTFAQHTASIATNGLAFNATGEFLASASYDKTAVIWDVASKQKRHVLKGHTGSVLSLAFSPDSRLLATGSDDKTIRLWDIASETAQILTGHQKDVFALRFLGQGEQLISAGADRDIRIWDTESGVTLRLLQGHDAGVLGLASYAGQLFSVSNDGTLRRWSLALPYQQRITLAKSPFSVAIAPDLQHVIVGFKDGALQGYDSHSGALEWEKTAAHNELVTRLAFNRQGTLLASSSADRTAKIWQFTPTLTPDKQLLNQQNLLGHTDVVHAVAFAPDSQRVATASYDGSIGLFTLQGQQAPTFLPTAHQGKVTSVSFSKTGQDLLSSGGEDRTTSLWHLYPTPRLVKRFPKTNDELSWTTLSPDSHYAASAGRDQVVDIYNIESGLLKYRLEGHQETVYKAIFSPDNLQLASVGDTSIRFWNLDKGSELFTLHLPVKDLSSEASIWDVDFRCDPEQCLVAAPLANNKLMLYRFNYQHQEGHHSAEQVWVNQVVLRQSYLDLVTMLHAQQASAAERQAQQEVDALERRLIQENQQDKPLHRSSLLHFLQQAQAQKKARQLTAALASYQKAVICGEILLKQRPVDLQLQAEVFTVFHETAATLAENQQPAQANALYQRLFALPLDNNLTLLVERIALAEQQDAAAAVTKDVQTLMQRIDRQNAKVLDDVGYALAILTHRYAEAFELLQQALRLQPGNAMTLDSFGWLLHKMGKSEESLPYLRQAQIHLPHSNQDPAELAAHLTEVLWIVGQKTEARTVLLQGLQSYPHAPLLHEVAKRLQIKT